MSGNNHIPKVSIGMRVVNEKSKPLITTIIPTYRRPKLLGRAIKSVLNQTYPHFQVCVYDNASGDETAEVVANIARQDKRVKYFCHSENIGAQSNFSYGVKQVATPYFSFLSDDDLLLPDFYRLALDKLSIHADAVFFAGSTIHVSSGGKPFVVPLSGWRKGLYSPPDGLINMWEKAHPTWTGILFRRQLVDQLSDMGNFSSICDLELELRIARYSSFYVSLEPVAIFTFGDNTASYHRSLKDVWPSIKTCGEIYFSDPELSSEVKERIYLSSREKARGALLGVGTSSLIRKRPSEALNAARLCITHYGLSRKAAAILMLSKVAVLDERISAMIAKILKNRRRKNLNAASLEVKKYIEDHFKLTEIKIYEKLKSC